LVSQGDLDFEVFSLDSLTDYIDHIFMLASSKIELSTENDLKVLSQLERSNKIVLEGKKLY
jgi:hypothetical protein